MSYKFLQLSPQASAHETSMRIVIQGPWSLPPGTPRDLQFLRSWMEYDSERNVGSRGRANWGAISGIALALGISASFWAGVAWIVARVWG